MLEVKCGPFFVFQSYQGFICLSLTQTPNLTHHGQKQGIESWGIENWREKVERSLFIFSLILSENITLFHSAKYMCLLHHK